MKKVIMFLALTAIGFAVTAQVEIGGGSTCPIPQRQQVFIPQQRMEPPVVNVNAPGNNHSPISITIVSGGEKQKQKTYSNNRGGKKVVKNITTYTTNNYYYSAPYYIEETKPVIIERNQLHNFFDSGLASILLFALLCGLIIALIYRLGRPSSPAPQPQAPIHQTFNNYGGQGGNGGVGGTGHGGNGTNTPPQAPTPNTEAVVSKAETSAKTE